MGYQIRDQQALYFLTFTVVGWADIFTRPHYKDMVIDSLRYCQAHKGLELFAHCLMTNHLHLIARATEGHELSNIGRDCKKFTANCLFKEITGSPTESRRNWLRWLLTQEGERNPSNQDFQLWQQRSHGVELRTEEMTRQRLAYCHANPVRAGICYRDEVERIRNADIDSSY